MQVLGEIDSKQLGQGFRTPGLIRFVSQETGYLSPTSDGPRMFVNLEDYLSHTTGQPNTQFQVRHTPHSLLMLQRVSHKGILYVIQSRKYFAQQLPDVMLIMLHLMLLALYVLLKRRVA
jgi:hypothetical protein